MGNLSNRPCLLINVPKTSTNPFLNHMFQKIVTTMEIAKLIEKYMVITILHNSTDGIEYDISNGLSNRILCKTCTSQTVCLRLHRCYKYCSFYCKIIAIETNLSLITQKNTCFNNRCQSNLKLISTLSHL